MRRSWKRGKSVNKDQKFDRDTPVAMKESGIITHCEMWYNEYFQER